ncbi:MAG: hypothetical protein CL471_09535 [Acidobacteria bacterium]|nr:hypothetical protein [Acidobacteriota bacterium]
MAVIDLQAEHLLSRWINGPGVGLDLERSRPLHRDIEAETRPPVVNGATVGRHRPFGAPLPAMAQEVVECRVRRIDDIGTDRKLLNRSIVGKRFEMARGVAGRKRKGDRYAQPN